MKTKILTAIILIIGFSACTQKTCPTYAKKDVQVEKSVKSIN